MPKKKNKNSKSKKSSKKKNGNIIQGWMQRINAAIAWLTTDTKPQNNTSTKKKEARTRRRTPHIAQGSDQNTETKTLLRKIESQTDVDSLIDNIKEEDRTIITGLGTPVSGFENRHREMAAFVLDAGDGNDKKGQFIYPDKKRFDPIVVEAKTLIEQSGYIITGDVTVPIKTIAIINSLGTSQLMGEAGGQSLTGEELNSIQKKLFQIYDEAAKAGASDIHIDATKAGTSISFRIYGEIRPFQHETYETGLRLNHIAAIVATEGDSHYDTSQFQDKNMRPGEFTLPRGIESLRLHWNPLSDEGRQVVIRLNKEPKRIRIEDAPFLKAGFTPDQDDAFRRFRQKKDGMLILSGPTGSGKTTTLTMNATILYYERDTRIAINTLEDPVEQPIIGACQTSVPSSKYKDGLKAMVRSDPDVLVVSEMRDGPSSDQAIQAARTGHLMMTTTHCSRALTIPRRIIDMGVDRLNVLDGSIMKLWVSQRLVGVICPHCGLSYEEGIRLNKRTKFECESVKNFVPEEYFPKLKMVNPDMAERLYGCGKRGCRYGQSGATIIAEVIEPDQEFMELLRKGQDKDAEKYWLEKLNGTSLAENCLFKACFGLIDPRDLLGVVESPNEIDLARTSRLLSEKAEKWYGASIQ